MNNSTKSVTNEETNSKVTNERKGRKASYKKKFGSHPHMIIPQADFAWVMDKHNSVKTLFMNCWMSDPYGSHWQVLNHSLKRSSFKSAKKILSEAGLFIFKSDRSIRDGRETICWLVMNLHGARRNDYWLKEEKLEVSELATEVNGLTPKVSELATEVNGLTPKVNGLTSISIKTHTQQAFQNPSVTSQERLSNSSKELLETLPVDPEGDRSDQKLALEEPLSSASSANEKKENDSVLPTQEKTSLNRESEFATEGPQALNKKSTDILNQEYKFDRGSTEATKRSVAQNLAIEAQRSTPEYQSAFSDASARIKANFEARKSRKFKERARRLRGES